MYIPYEYKFKIRISFDFDVNTSLKSVPGTPHVRRLERHEISSKLFCKIIHDVLARSGPV